MDQTRLPAWKRLGLKLQKFDHPEEHVKEPQTSGAQHGAVSGLQNASSEHHDTSVAPIEDINLRLGKRKHLAEPEDQARKRSRNTLVHDAPPPSEKSQPKGDPNYRKKKGSHITQKQQLVSEPLRPHFVGDYARERRPQTPSLSPSCPELDPDGARLLVSTETDFLVAPVALSQQQRAIKGISKGDLSSSPSRPDRRKSVTFTPDTKTADGNSTSILFKKWVQEQKGAGADFTPAEVAQFVPPPTIHPANNISAPSPTSNKEDKKSRKTEKKVKRAIEGPTQDPSDKRISIETASEPATQSLDVQVRSTAAKTKKDPSRYIAYLTQYHEDRPNWKFSKAKQNDVLDNALNIFRIPGEHEEALLEYVRGLKGAGVIERLKQRCTTTIEEVAAADKEAASTMDDAEVRKAAQEEALQERLSKERKRRRLESDIENMLDHPYSEGYIRRLKRGRAAALLTALNMAAPAPAPIRINGTVQTPAQKVPRKRKLRTEMSSDESSDSSDSSDSCSSSEVSSGSSEEESSDDDSGSDSESSSVNKQKASNGRPGSSSGNESESESESSVSENEDVSEEDSSDGDSDSESS